MSLGDCLDRKGATAIISKIKKGYEDALLDEE